MKNFTIENAKTDLFESKEHYLQFRQAWKDFHNSDKLVWREDVEQYSWALRKDIVIKNVKHTALGAEHYMLYNLLRGYDAQRGFREDSDHGWCACEYAAYNIRRAALRLKDVNSPYDSSRSTSRKLIENLLLPFGGTVSHEMIMEVGKQITELFYGNDSSKYFDFEIEEWKEPKEKVSLKSKLKLWAEKV